MNFSTQKYSVKRGVFALLLVACVGSPMQGHVDREGVVIRRDQPVVVDGVLDEWEDSVRLDPTGQLQVSWNANSLFLAFRIQDSDLYESPKKHEIYLGDSVEIGLDLGNDSTFDYMGDDYQFAFAVPDESDAIEVAMYRHGGERREVDSYLKASGRRVPGGYELEVSLDWEALGSFRPENGAAIGFEYVVTRYSTGLPINRFTWSGMKFSLREPIRWGDLIFLDNPNADGVGPVARLKKHREKAQVLFAGRYEDPVPEGPVPDAVFADMRKMRERLIEQWNRPVDATKIRNYVETISPNGSWPALRYEYQDGYARSEVKRHLYWLEDLAVAWHFDENPGYSDPEVFDALNRALDFWLENKYSFSNWWENEIGVPLIIGHVALLMGNHLTVEQKAAVLPILRKAYNKMTGQNLIWINQIILMRGILEENPALVHKALDAVAAEIRLTVEEGIQPDYSFHQHGAQLYSHGYGAGFVLDSLQILSCAAGGSFEIGADKREIIEHYLLDGSRWMARGSFADFGAQGRNVSRRNQTATYLGKAARLLLTFATERSRELRQLASSAIDQSPDLLEGNRYFYRSDFMVQRREAFYASVKMYSVRTIGTESFSGEGLKSYYLPDGCMLLVRNGDEYKEIMPIWDWRKLPGVTCPQSDDPIPSIDYHEARTLGNTAFVGGVSDGWNGCCVFDYQRDGVSAHKGYFGFDWGMVCLGSGLDSDREDPIATTLNQCYLRSPVWLGYPSNPNPVSVPKDRQVEGSFDWVHHDDVLYYLGGEGKALLEVTEQSGSWWDINHNDSKELISGNVFTLSLQHGEQPRGASYSYAVFPGVKYPEIQERLEDLPFRILANKPELQAVSDIQNGITECIFYRPGNLELDSGTILSVDQPCVLLLVQGVEETTVTMVNPKNEALQVTLVLEEQDGEGPIKCVFNLPGGSERGGSPVSQKLTWSGN